MRKRYTDEDIVYIEQQARRGVSCKEIGSSLDVSAASIQHAFRTGLISPSYGQSHHRTALNEQQIKTCSEMHQNGRTFAEIAEIFGVGRHTVSRHVNLYRRSTERSETIP